MTERIVEVTWVDSSLRHGWQDRDGLDQQVAQCASFGIVEKDDETGILLLFQTATYEGDDKGFCCSSFIPRSAIRKVTELVKKR